MKSFEPYHSAGDKQRITATSLATGLDKKFLIINFYITAVKCVKRCGSILRPKIFTRNDFVTFFTIEIFQKCSRRTKCYKTYQESKFTSSFNFFNENFHMYLCAKKIKNIRFSLLITSVISPGIIFKRPLE